MSNGEGRTLTPMPELFQYKKKISGPATDIQNMKFWVPIEPKLSDVINRSA